MQKRKPTDIVIWGALLTLAFVWGSSFILMKIGLFDALGRPVYTPIEVASLRISIAGLVMLPVTFRFFRKIPKSKWFWLLCVGMFGNMLPAYLFTSAQAEIPSAVAGMLNALTPIFTMLVAAVLFRTQVSKRQFSGLGIGFIGAIVLARGNGGLATVEGGIAWWACGRVVLATIFYGLSVNIIKNKLQGVSSIVIAAVALAMVMPLSLVVLSQTNISTTLLTNPHGIYGMIAIIVLSAFGTAGALILFNTIIKWSDALTASSVAYIIPVFATMWGWLDGEILTSVHLVGGGIILIGVSLVNKGIKLKKTSS